MLYVCFTTLVVCCGGIKEGIEPNTFEVGIDFDASAAARAGDSVGRVGEIGRNRRTICNCALRADHHGALDATLRCSLVAKG